jgi:hypothetical protein
VALIAWAFGVQDKRIHQQAIKINPLYWNTFLGSAAEAMVI